MDTPAPQTPATASRSWAAAVLLISAGPACCGAGWLTTAIAGHDHAVRLIGVGATSLGALLLVFVVPWLLGTLAIRRFENKRATAGAWSLAANSAAVFLVCLLLRGTVGISRGSFLVAWLAWTAFLLRAAGGPASAIAELGRLWRPWRAGILIGIAAAAAGVVLFAPEQFLQCFNGDGTEAWELAASLRGHLLPYWEIDAVGRFGTVVVYPALICSYWSFAVQLLVDDAEIAARLAYWVWWLGIFAVGLNLTRCGGAAPRWTSALALAMAGLLCCLWYTFYTGHYPYMADLACLGIPDALFTLLLLLGLDCLRQKDLAGWAVMMVLGSLVIYAGPVMMGLSFLAALVWRPVPGGRMLRGGLAGGALLLGIVCFYLAWGWQEGSLPGWRATIQEEYLDDFFSPAEASASRAAYACYFLLGCGGIAALGLVLPFCRKGCGESHTAEIAWQRTAATVAVLYLLIVLKSEARSLHYLGPLLPIPVILWLKQGQQAGGRTVAAWAVPLSAAVTLAISICLCWPARRPVFTLNRELGAITTFQTDSYQQACRWSKLIHPLYHRGLISWEVGPHTWLGYSELDGQPRRARPLLVTTGRPPSAEYRPLLESSDGVTLYSRDPGWAGWLKDRRPAAGPQRFPRVLRRAAVWPTPPENVGR